MAKPSKLKRAIREMEKEAENLKLRLELLETTIIRLKIVDNEKLNEKRD